MVKYVPERLDRSIEELLSELPFYCNEYTRSKRSSNQVSKTTIYEYLKIWNKFFNFLVAQNSSKLSKPTDIDPDYLNNLTKKSVESYIYNCISKGKSLNTINAHISALKSLFKFLSIDYEDDNLNVLIERNVMNKFHLLKDNTTLASRAKKLQQSLLLDNETKEFLSFLKYDYSELLLNQNNKKSYNLYLRNKERNIAMIALMLASGIRVSECSSIMFKDLNFEDLSISVTRKSNKDDLVYFAEFAKEYIVDYLNIRDERYKAPSTRNDFLFITDRYKNGTKSPISVSAIEKFVDTYSTAFGKRLTPHMFRHTLATRLYNSTNSKLIVSTQLGHSDTRTSDVYVHTQNDDLKNAIDLL